MDDDLKADVRFLESMVVDLDYAAMPTKPDVVTLCGSQAARTRDAIRTLLSALRQRDEALESLRAERDLYRLVAVNQGWNWRLCEAYGRDEYQKQREKHVDDCVAVAQSQAARAILTGSETATVPAEPRNPPRPSRDLDYA